MCFLSVCLIILNTGIRVSCINGSSLAKMEAGNNSPTIYVNLKSSLANSRRVEFSLKKCTPVKLCIFMSAEGTQLSHKVGVPFSPLWSAAISLWQRESQDLRFYYKSDDLDFL